jgi:3-ketoacyl-CoA synthase
VRHLAERNGTVAPGDIDFMEKLAFRSGLGDATAVTPAIQHAGQRKPGIEAARQEYMDTCFACVSELLEKTGVAPAKVKFVITNSSLFNPTPSLSAAIMNRFRMRDDTINYSLGGMGCSGEACAPGVGRGPSTLALSPLDGSSPASL